MKIINQFSIGIMIFCVCVLSPLYAQAQDNVYCNNRYNFCLQYPLDILTEKLFSTNDDGVELHSADEKMIVTVSGSHNVLNSAIQEEFDIFKTYLENNKPEFNIFSSNVEKDQFVLYASNENEVYYQKTFSTGLNLVHLTIISKMDSFEESKMAIEKIEKNLIFLVHP